MAEKKGRGKIAAAAEQVIRPVIEEAGYLLWDVDYYKEGADFNLLVTIDKEDKQIDLDDCETVSRLISPVLDENDPTDTPYYLEVSSPGLERELLRPEHFQYFLSSPVTVRLYAPRNGGKFISGILSSYENGDITIQTEEEEIHLKKEEVAKVTTVFENQEFWDDRKGTSK